MNIKEKFSILRTIALFTFVLSIISCSNVKEPKISISDDKDISSSGGIVYITLGDKEYGLSLCADETSALHNNIPGFYNYSKSKNINELIFGIHLKKHDTDVSVSFPPNIFNVERVMFLRFYNYDKFKYIRICQEANPDGINIPTEQDEIFVNIKVPKTDLTYEISPNFKNFTSIFGSFGNQNFENQDFTYIDKAGNQIKREGSTLFIDFAENNSDEDNRVKFRVQHIFPYFNVYYDIVQTSETE